MKRWFLMRRLRQTKAARLLASAQRRSALRYLNFVVA